MDSLHPIRAHRKGFVITVTDGQQKYSLRAESAPEARRFVERFEWMANLNPERTLAELMQATWTAHDAAFYAQRKRRFRSCFGTAA